MAGATVCRRTLEALPYRVFTFLSGIGASAEIRSLLARAGYSATTNEEGWSLLHALSGFRLGPEDFVPAPEPRMTGREAFAALDGWYKREARLLRRMLERACPEQAAFVFDGLEASPAAAVSVALLCDRLDALEKGRSEATRAADQAAIALLSKRGCGSSERARLREWLTTTRNGDVAPGESESNESAARGEALRRLYRWYTDWAEPARLVLKRRDHLIRLGLARRRLRTAADEADSAA